MNPTNNINNTLESKLKLEQENQDKHEKLKSLLDPEEFYRNCMYCGRIYSGNYERVIYQNGTGPLGREFNSYNISTGVGPCCMDKYRQQLDEIKRYSK